MLSPALNYDFICYPLKAQYFDQLDKGFQIEIDQLFNNVEKGLSENQSVKSYSQTQIKNLFNLRMKAITWLLEDGNLKDLAETIEECYDDFDSLSQNPKLIFFVENLKFALRANKRLLDHFVEHAHIEETNGNVNLEKEIKAIIPKINYDQFVTSIALGVPDEEAAQRIIDLVGASLLIEFSAILANIILEKKIDISEEKAIQVTDLIKNAAQDYSAICYELGLFKQNKSENFQMKFEHNFIEEQQSLADLGLEDLREN